MPFGFMLPLGTVVLWCLELYPPPIVELTLCIHVSVKAASLVLREEKSSWASGSFHSGQREPRTGIRTPLAVPWSMLPGRDSGQPCRAQAESKGTQIQQRGPDAGKSLVNNYLALKVLITHRNVCGIRSSGCFLKLFTCASLVFFFQHFIQAPSRTASRTLPWLCPI